MATECPLIASGSHQDQRSVSPPVSGIRKRPDTGIRIRIPIRIRIRIRWLKVRVSGIRYPYPYLYTRYPAQKGIPDTDTDFECTDFYVVNIQVSVSVSGIPIRIRS